MKKDDKIAKILKEHGKQTPPSIDFTEMVMAQLTEAPELASDAVRTLLNNQKEELIQSPSFNFEAELFEKIAKQNTKAKVHPVFSQRSLIIALVASVITSLANMFFAQKSDSQFFEYEKYFQLLQGSTSASIVITAIIIGGGMYVLDYFLRENLSIK